MTYWIQCLAVCKIALNKILLFETNYTVFKKDKVLHCLSYTCIVDEVKLIVKIFFIGRLGKQFATKLSLNVSPHLKRVATLLCKI